MSSIPRQMGMAQAWNAAPRPNTNAQDPPKAICLAQKSDINEPPSCRPSIRS